MEIADGVLAHARQIERSYGAPLLALRVESPRGPADLMERIRAAIATINGAEELYWSVDVEPAGVIVRQWGHASEIGAVFARLAA